MIDIKKIKSEIDDIASMNIASATLGENKFCIDWEKTAKAMKQDLFELKRRIVNGDFYIEA